MINFLADLLFECSHRKTSFPLTPVRGAGAYVACLECGKEFPYNWQEMRMERPAPPAARGGFVLHLPYGANR